MRSPFRRKHSFRRMGSRLTPRQLSSMSLPQLAPRIAVACSKFMVSADPRDGTVTKKTSRMNRIGLMGSPHTMRDRSSRVHDPSSLPTCCAAQAERIRESLYPREYGNRRLLGARPADAVHRLHMVEAVAFTRTHMSYI